MRFDGKVAIITGSASGIGKATAELMASEGCKILIADLSPDGERLALSLVDQGFEAIYRKIDVSREDQVSNMVSAAVDRWGRLDVMVANAGIGGRGSADETPLGDWEHVLAVNLTGVFLCSKHAIPAMRATGGGAIVNTASIMGIVGTQGAASYIAAKGAVISLTRSTALDCARHQIRVNAVCPGHLDEPPSRGGAVARVVSKEDLVALYPIGRLGLPSDIANAIAFLASAEASFITGTSLVVDGGYTAR